MTTILLIEIFWGKHSVQQPSVQQHSLLWQTLFAGPCKCSSSRLLLRHRRVFDLVKDAICPAVSVCSRLLHTQSQPLKLKLTDPPNSNVLETHAPQTKSDLFQQVPRSHNVPPAGVSARVLPLWQLPVRRRRQSRSGDGALLRVRRQRVSRWGNRRGVWRYVTQDGVDTLKSQNSVILFSIGVFKQ